MSKRGVLVLIVLITGILGLTQRGRLHEWLAIREVVIEGGERITADDVQRLIDISVGDNFFQADVQGAARSLRQHPWIATATVWRRYPRVYIRLEERVPFVVAQDPQGQAIWCDAQGYVLAPVEDLPGEDPAVLVSGVGPRVETADGPRLGQARQWALIRQVVRWGRTLKLGITRVELTRTGIEVEVEAGQVIRLPQVGLGSALQRLAAVWPLLRERVSFQSVDLRFPGELIYEGPH